MGKTKIDSRGVVTQGGRGVEIGGDSANIGFHPFALRKGSTTAQTAENTTTSFSFDGVGLHYVSGSTQCTASVPDPGLYPGSFLMTILTNVQPAMLSGSATISTKVFCMSGLASTGSAGSAAVTQRGNTLTLTSGGGVTLFSDGYSWYPFVSSGSITLA